jgi:hypothetical protein
MTRGSKLRVKTGDVYNKDKYMQNKVEVVPDTIGDRKAERHNFNG